MKLSILVPVYNERTVVERSLAQVLGAPLPEDMEREISARDESDTNREVAPLVWMPEGATVIDTTELSVEQVIERIVSAVRGAPK